MVFSQFRLSPRSPLRLGLSLRREAQRHPLLAKAIPTAIGFAFGDCLTQYMNRDRTRSLKEQYRYHRTVLMFGAGAALAAPVLLVFNQWMDVHLLPEAAGTAPLQAAKFILDQIVGCIFWQAAYITINPQYRKSAINLVDTAVTQTDVLISRGRLLLPHS